MTDPRTDCTVWRASPCLSLQEMQQLVELAPASGWPCNCSHPPTDHGTGVCLGGLAAVTLGGYEGISVCACAGYAAVDLEDY